MLINMDEQSGVSHVEFVSYTGKWPNLCGGILTLAIDGKTVTFGHSYDDEKVDHQKFWSTGGSCSIKAIHTGEWLIDVQKIPEEYRKYAAEIDVVFNMNVEYGCCGGCR